MKEGWEGGSGRAERMIDRPEDQKKLAIAMGSQIRGGDQVLKLEGLAIGYVHRATGASHQLLKSPDLEIWRGRRVALMGPNGSGKTTLLRTIVGELPPLRGRVRLGHRVIVNYYAQAHEGLNHQATILGEIRRIKPDIKESEARTLLGRFLFSGDDVFKQVGDLSGGERSRVALAQLTLMGGNLLVLDEPTNHLDIGAREALESVLNEYNGTILFVSHDRYFIDAVADTIWMVKDNTVEAFDGTYSEYVADREKREKAAARKPAVEERPATKAPQPVSTPANAAAAPPPLNGAANGAHAQAAKPDAKEERKRQRKLASLEQEIAMLEQELKQIEADMTAAGIQADTKKVSALSTQYREVQEMLQRRYDEWATAAG
jgi:ATP-binding cassette subfamily F protein 3